MISSFRELFFYFRHLFFCFQQAHMLICGRSRFGYIVLHFVVQCSGFLAYEAATSPVRLILQQDTPRLSRDMSKKGIYKLNQSAPLLKALTRYKNKSRPLPSLRTPVKMQMLCDFSFFPRKHDKNRRSTRRPFPNSASWSVCPRVPLSSCVPTSP